METEEQEEKVHVFRQGIDPVPEGEELEYDPRYVCCESKSERLTVCSAYIMYHSLRVEWPCLSFDILRDDGGENRVRFPLTMYLVCGTQADASEKNKLTLLKLSEMHRTHAGEGRENS